MEKNLLSFVGHEVVINGAHHVRAGAIELVLLVDRLLCNKHGKVFEKDGVRRGDGRGRSFYSGRVSNLSNLFPSHWKFDAVIGKM